MRETSNLPMVLFSLLERRKKICSRACSRKYSLRYIYIQEEEEKKRIASHVCLCVYVKKKERKSSTEMKKRLHEDERGSLCEEKNLHGYCADVGVIDAAQDNFRGMSVSGVGISWPVTVSGTMEVVTSLLLFNRILGSGLLDDNLPWALATL